MTVLRAHSAEDRKKLVQILERSAKPQRKRRNKYNNRVTYVDNKRFDSKAEANRYIVLRDLESEGKIQDLKCQVPFTLYAHSDDGKVKLCVYKADFTYTNTRTGEPTTEDVKGKDTALYRLKKKLMRANYGIEINEVRAR